MNLLKSLVTMSFMTFCSRVLGFIRDTVIARLFGAGMETDSFLVAFKLPNLLRRIFAEGAFSQAFISILAEYKSEKNDTDTRNFIACIAGLLTFMLTLVTVSGMLAAPWIILITAPGFVDTPEQFALTTTLLRITFPYILFISLASLVGIVLNTWNYFSVPAFAPTLLNISIICFSLLAISLFNPPIMTLAWAVIIGGILQLSYQLPYLKKIGMMVLPRLQFCNDDVWKVLRLMGPAVIGVSVSQISLFINSIFLSFLVSGSISWIYYADRLMEFSSGIFGVTLGTILMPLLSRTVSCGNNHDYSLVLDWGLRLCFTLALPSAVALGLLAHPLTVALFQYGKFTSFDTIMTQQAIIAYSIGLIGLLLVKVLAPGFYSRQDLKTPMRIAIFTLIITQIMNLIFIDTLKHVGLSLSIGLAACMNAGLLYWQLRRQNIFQPQPGWCCFLCRLMIAVLIMAVTFIFMLMVISDWTQGTMFYRLTRLTGVVTIGIVVYVSTLWLIGFKFRTFSHPTKCIKKPLSSND